MKKIAYMIATFACVITLFLTVIPVESNAASTTKCYTINTGNTTVYSNTGLTKKYGTIYDTDEITVLTVASKYAKVTYPISGGKTKTGYIKTSNILTKTSGSNKTATKKMITYRRASTTNQYGYVSKNDKYTVYGNKGSFTQVKYPVSGGYKYAFVKTSDIFGVSNVQGVEKAISWAQNIANDDTHGYSQAQNRRWGKPDYDCSSYVISAFKSAGFNVGAATYTGNMKSVFTKAGFEWIPKSRINVNNSNNLKRGDILLNEKKHTEIYIGGGKMIGAHYSTDGGKKGDTYGNEICVVNYSNRSNWDGVLRYSK